MSAILVVAIALAGLLAAISVLHAYARWTIRNIDRQQAIAPSRNKPISGTANESWRNRGDIR